MDTRIYVMTHKKIEEIPDELYIPLHVGRKGKEDLGYPGDDTGVSISEKNSSYCELTGLYWIWKNVKCDVVGICHYRRFFLHEDHILTKEYIEKTLEDYPVIIPNTGSSIQNSVQKQYEEVHYKKDLLICADVIRERHPEYGMAFEVAIHCNMLSPGNMWITKKEIFDQYCCWLFDILFEAEKRIDSSGYDDYQKRVMGFLSERLFRVWLLMQRYPVQEEKVEVIDAAEVCKDLKMAGLLYRYTETLLAPLLQIYKSRQGESLAGEKQCRDDFQGKIPVWVCWWQGEDSAPEEVRMCLDSIRRNIPKDLAVLRLITLENCREYVTFTDTVVRKFQEGKISHTHLSDILRAELLYRYGGMWLDATYYVAGKMPEWLFQRDVFWTIKFENPLFWGDVVKGRWSGNFWKTPPRTRLFQFLMEGLWYYWEVQEELRDYYLIDDVIAVAYEHIPEARESIDHCSCSSPTVFELQSRMNWKFDPQAYESLIYENIYFKLNRRIDYQKQDLIGRQTYYGNMWEQYSAVNEEKQESQGVSPRL